MAACRLDWPAPPYTQSATAMGAGGALHFPCAPRCLLERNPVISLFLALLLSQHSQCSGSEPAQDVAVSRVMDVHVAPDPPPCWAQKAPGTPLGGCLRWGTCRASVPKAYLQVPLPG